MLEGRTHEVLFFTCANRAYERFAPLYACAILQNIEGSKVEVGLEDAARFCRENAAALEVLAAHFGAGRLHWRNADFSRITPNTVRFVTEPQTPSKFVYIGDADIVMLERDAVEQHLAFMARTGLPYSNSVRPGTKRLSGLHFSKRDAYYPLPRLDGIDLNHDERALYEIVRRRGFPVQDQEWFRPVHGIHMSPNRPPVRGVGLDKKSHPDWGLPYWRTLYEAFRKTPSFSDLRPHLATAMLEALEIIDQFYWDNSTARS